MYLFILILFFKYITYWQLSDDGFTVVDTVDVKRKPIKAAFGGSDCGRSARLARWKLRPLVAPHSKQNTAVEDA